MLHNEDGELGRGCNASEVAGRRRRRSGRTSSPSTGDARSAVNDGRVGTRSGPNLSDRGPHVLRAHLRVPDERARLRAHRRPARGRRAGGGRRSVDDADVVVLNTCCIRENADNKLYGNLGHLKSAEGRPPGLQIVGRPAAWPRRTATLIAERAPYVDVVLGTHNVHRAAELLDAGPRRTAPDHRDPRRGRRRRPRAVPVGAAGAARRRPRRRGSPSRSAATTRCAFCIVPVGAGPRDQPAVRRHRRRGRGAGRRRRHRGHPARPERQLLRPRPHPRGAPGRRARPVRPLFAELLRRGRRRRRHPPGPLHQPAPQGPAARDHRRRWPRRRRCASTSTCRCSPAATACSPPCTAATPPSATSSGSPRPAPPSPTWPSPPTSSSASRARPTTTSSAPSRWSPAAEYDCAYTFIYSPRPGTEAAELADRVRRSRRRRRALRAAAGRRRAQRAGQAPRPASAGSRRSLVEGPSKKDPAVTTGRTRQNKLVHFRADRPLRPGTYATAEVTDAAPHHLARRAGRRRGRARPPHAHPGGGWRV